MAQLEDNDAMTKRLNAWWDRSAERFTLETGKPIDDQLNEAETTRFADILEEEALLGGGAEVLYLRGEK